MLLELRIENFGIIENMRVRLGPGLNVITGETGAGKSLILQAIDVVLGSRAASGLVRNGAHRASVEALFDLNHQIAARKWLEANGYPTEDIYLTIRREISSDGRGRVGINGISARLSTLRTLSALLIEVHGQHEHQRLLDTETHLDSLDLFAGTMELRERTAGLYSKLASIRKRLRAVNLEKGERERRLDFLKFSLQEIDTFNPVENEYDELLHEQALIKNSGRMYSDVNLGYSLLREEEHSLLESIVSLENMFDAHARIHPGLESQLVGIREARYTLESFADFLRDERERLQFSPERMEDIDERISGYRKLYKKYGGSTDSVIAMQKDFLKELSMIESSDEEVEFLQSESSVVHSELKEVAEELSRRRRSVIPGLEENIKRELQELGMPGAELSISVKREMSGENWNSPGQIKGTPETDASMGMKIPQAAQNRYLINERGLDRVEFLLRANTGESFHPLRKIASGGEMSRIMLALKSVLIDQKPVGTVIFDEIDAGVGGEVAHAIAGRLKQHSVQSQVLVVTHLHQVAGQGDQHFFISKAVKNGRTAASMQLLQGEKRLHELARMLGGNSPGPIVLEHAKELLAHSNI